ncbi:hypothetical protein [Candidatus Nitrospira bockiana]
MKFDEAKAALQAIVENAGEASSAIVPTKTLKDILSGFDNDEQVLIMHNTALALLVRLGGEAELRPMEALEIHRTHSMHFSRLPEGTMLLKAVDKPIQG